MGLPFAEQRTERTSVRRNGRLIEMLTSGS